MSESREVHRRSRYWKKSVVGFVASTRDWPRFMIRFSRSKFFGVFSISILTVILSFPYADSLFFIDEGDNVMGGRALSNGDQIYGEFYSQHTPAAYWFFVVPGLLEINDIFLLRMLFFFALAGMWVLIFLLNHKFFHRLLVPVSLSAYVLSWATIGHPSSTMVADHISAVSSVGILLFALRDVTKHPYTTRDWVVFGVLSVLAIGSTFVSIYFVFVVFVAVAFRYFLSIRASQTLRDSLAIFTPKVFSFGLPFLAAGLYFVVTSSLGDFVYQAITFNQTTYSLYTAGFGSSAIQAPVDAVLRFLSLFETATAGIVSGSAYFASLLLVLIAPLLILSFRRFGFGFRLALAVAVVLVGVRTFEGFHGLPYWAVAWTILVFAITSLKFSAGRRLVVRIAAVGSIFLVFLPLYPAYSAEISAGVDKTRVNLSSTEASVTSVLDIGLNPDETFWQTGLEIEHYIYSNRRQPTVVYGLVPWFVDDFGEEILKPLTENPPPIVLHSDESSVWGYKITDFAPEIVSWIKSEYTLFADTLPRSSQSLWLRNDVFRERQERLVLSMPSLFCFDDIATQRLSKLPVGEILPEKPMLQSFIATREGLNSVVIQLATYNMVHNSSYVFSILDAQSNTLFSTGFRASGVEDNLHRRFEFPQIEDAKGNTYWIKISTTDAVAGNAITAWHSDKDLYLDGELYLGSELKTGDLNFSVGYKADWPGC